MLLHKEAEHLRFLRRGKPSRADTEEQSWLVGGLKKACRGGSGKQGVWSTGSTDDGFKLFNGTSPSVFLLASFLKSTAFTTVCVYVDSC